LQESQRKLVDVAHDAGRAEIAKDVLHNVGNVLNSASVSAEVASRTLANSEVPSLARAVQLLEEHRGALGEFLAQDPRGQLLPGFLAELSTELAKEQGTMRREVATITASLDHIREIVRAQNEHSAAAPLLARLEPGAVVEQALALTADSFQRHRIRVETVIETREPLLLDRHRLLQILGNLLTNAKLAVREAATDDPRIRIVVRQGDSPAGRRLLMAVTDNGVGIPHENLERIFGAGFSTRPGNRGRGLHSAANQARELGGDLTVVSEGPGRGATFTLSLPVVHPEEPA
jgi:signal transduction histidine kinase